MFGALVQRVLSRLDTGLWKLCRAPGVSRSNDLWAAFPSTLVNTECYRKERRVLGFSGFGNAQPGQWESPSTLNQCRGIPSATACSVCVGNLLQSLLKS